MSEYFLKEKLNFEKIMELKKQKFDAFYEKQKSFYQEEIKKWKRKNAELENQ